MNLKIKDFLMWVLLWAFQPFHFCCQGKTDMKEQNWLTTTELKRQLINLAINEKGRKVTALNLYSLATIFFVNVLDFKQF